MPPSSPTSALRWFATARGLSLAVKLAALVIFAVLLARVFLAGGL